MIGDASYEMHLEKRREREKGMREIVGLITLFLRCLKCIGPTYHGHMHPKGKNCNPFHVFFSGRCAVAK